LLLAVVAEVVVIVVFLSSSIHPATLSQLKQGPSRWTQLGQESSNFYGHLQPSTQLYNQFQMHSQGNYRQKGLNINLRRQLVSTAANLIDYESLSSFNRY